jgi:glycosyltransferase involved in cell wall biosynthesis
MKICFCIGRLSFSGAENVVRYLTENLAKCGHDVSVMLLGSMPSENEIIPDVAVKDAIVEGSGIKNIIKRVSLERKVLKETAPDVFVIFNCEMAFSAIPASLCLRKTNVVVCERNDPLSVPSNLKKRKLRDFLYRFADAGVYQTEVISDYFKKITPKKTVIYNPIRETGEKCLPILKRDKIFVTVARLDNRQKNQIMMMRAFLRASENHPDYQLHILGEGPDREKYEKFIVDNNAEGKIILKGHVSNPFDYIKSCRAFVLTSEFEGMPNALLEAMSIGLPCVSTDCGGGGAAALIENEVNGILINRCDEEALVNGYIRLMENDELCNLLGEEAYKMNDRLSGDKIVSQWDEFLKACCH